MIKTNVEVCGKEPSKASNVYTFIYINYIDIGFYNKKCRYKHLARQQHSKQENRKCYRGTILLLL